MQPAAFSPLFFVLPILFEMALAEVDYHAEGHYAVGVDATLGEVCGFCCCQKMLKIRRHWGIVTAMLSSLRCPVQATSAAAAATRLS